jgi:hypothetical protein
MPKVSSITMKMAAFQMLVATLLYSSVAGDKHGPRAPPSTPGITFNASFGSNMVLQQRPAKACVYGLLGTNGQSAEIRISGTTDAGDDVAYGVAAVVSENGSGWKACLQPEAAGGDYTITATCTGCTNKTTAVITQVSLSNFL